MSSPSPETLEGRLLAQRQIIGHLLAMHALGPEAARRAAQDLLEDASPPADPQEDPGAVPSEAFAIEGMVQDERRLIVEEARRVLQAAGRRD